MIPEIEQYEGLNVTFNVTESCNLKCKYCVAAGTKILLSSLEEKNIEDIKIGNKILAFEEWSSLPGLHRKIQETEVIKLFKNKDHIIHITTESGLSIDITKNHPILSSVWREAGKYRVGDMIKTFSKVDYSEKFVLKDDKITSIEEKNEEIDVYNFETTSHTYIANNICVHNCYELDKQPNDLPFDYAQKFIDILLDDPDPIGVLGTDNEWMVKSNLILDFIGGDALMRPELVDRILSYLIFRSTIQQHRWSTRWRASISTNGTLFENPGVKEFLLKYRDNMSLGVSVDGCPEIHNFNRSNSMDAILKSWDWYLWYMGERASTKATLNLDSIPHLYKSLKFLHEDMRLSQINMNFIFEPMHESKSDLLELEKQLEKCVSYTLDHRNDLFWSVISKNFANAEKMKDPNKGWCGAGAMPCLGVNGKIYPCFRFMPHTMSSRNLDFPVGDVWKGFDHKERFKEVRDQTRIKISPKKCFDCPIESNCSWCIGSSFSESGEFYRQTNICEFIKIQTKWAKIYWKEYDRLEGTNSFTGDTCYNNCSMCSSFCAGKET